MSGLRAVRKRKKGRELGAIDIIRREAYVDRELDAKVELIRALVPLGLLHVQELLDQEVTALAGARYARKDESVDGQQQRRVGELLEGRAEGRHEGGRQVADEPDRVCRGRGQCGGGLWGTRAVFEGGLLYLLSSRSRLGRPRGASRRVLSDTTGTPAGASTVRATSRAR